MALDLINFPSSRDILPFWYLLACDSSLWIPVVFENLLLLWILEVYFCIWNQRLKSSAHKAINSFEHPLEHIFILLDEYAQRWFNLSQV